MRMSKIIRSTALLLICGLGTLPAEMKEAVFSQYDIRGRVGEEIDLDEIYDLGRAIALYFKEQNPNLQRVAVGRDGRLTSEAIEEEITSAFLESGIDVVSIGLSTSPLLYFALEKERFDGALMVTASHNPKEDNGLKILCKEGPVCKEELQAVKKLFYKRAHITTQARGERIFRSFTDDYIDFLALQFSHLKGAEFSPLFDCGNGAAGALIPKLIEKMEWKNAGLLYQEVDGEFPNRNSDPTKEANLRGLKEKLAATHSGMGIAFDGDGDRMVAMTKEGELLLGDQLLGIFSKQVLKEHPDTSVVFDISCSSALKELLLSLGAKPLMVPVGAVNVRGAMKEPGALLGGEISCHFFFRDRYFGYDDGVYAALRLLEITHLSGQNISALLADYPKKFSTPTIRLPCTAEEKREVICHLESIFSRRSDLEIIAIDGIRIEFKRGWGIVRPSNTEPKLSMRFEADTAEELASIKALFIDALEFYFDKAALKSYFEG